MTAGKVPAVSEQHKEEETWRFSKVVEGVDSAAGGLGNSLRQPAQSVRKSAKFRLSRAETGRFIAGIVTQSASQAAAARRQALSLPLPSRNRF